MTASHAFTSDILVDKSSFITVEGCFPSGLSHFFLIAVSCDMEVAVIFFSFVCGYCVPFIQKQINESRP